MSVICDSVKMYGVKSVLGVTGSLGMKHGQPLLDIKVVSWHGSFI